MMYSAYLSSPSLNGYSCRALFIEPYTEGLANLTIASGRDKAASVALKSICEVVKYESKWELYKVRTLHFVTAILLLIPLVNIVALLILRANARRLSFSVTLKNKAILEEVEICIGRFLLPYINGKVKPEAEEQRCRPVVKDLFDYLSTKYSIAPEEAVPIVETALYFYVKFSVTGFYTFLNKKDVFKRGVRLTPQSKELVQLIDALRPALKKDFPFIEMTAAQLEKIVVEALKAVNQENSA